MIFKFIRNLVIDLYENHLGSVIFVFTALSVISAIVPSFICELNFPSCKSITNIITYFNILLIGLVTMGILTFISISLFCYLKFIWDYTKRTK